MRDARVERDFFGEERVRRAPAKFNPAEWKRLRLWAEDHVPWIARGAFGSLTTLEEYVDTVLIFFQQGRKMRPGWVASVQNWVRREERSRLMRLAASGNENARLALRAPVQWREQFDRLAKEAKLARRPSEAAMLRPSGGTFSALGDVR